MREGFLVSTKGITQMHANTKRLGAFALGSVLMALVGAAPSAWADDPWSGSGTSDDPYQISSVADLQALMQWVNDAHDTTGVYFEQTADTIDLSSVEWDGIGGKSMSTVAGGCFFGVYDGKGKSIVNLKFSAANKYQGLFNSVKNATIKNLSVAVAGFKEGFVTTFGSPDFKEMGAAPFCGSTYNDTIISNCHATGFLGAADYPATHNTAGMVVLGNSGLTIVDCSSSVNIVGNGTKLSGIVNITGDNNYYVPVTLKNVSYSGSITHKANGEPTDQGGIAGFVAYATYSQIILDGCSFTGTLTDEVNDPLVTTNYLGSVFGFINNTSHGADYATNGCTTVSGIPTIGRTVNNAVMLANLVG